MMKIGRLSYGSVERCERLFFCGLLVMGTIYCRQTRGREHSARFWKFCKNSPPSGVLLAENSGHSGMFALHQQWLSSTNPQHYHEFRTALTTRNHIPLADQSSHSGDSEDSLDFNNNDLVELDDNDVDDIHTQYPPAHEMVVDPAFNVEEILQE
eukprot:scaffold20716_cov50-Cyclotella_meneghiniana.AAC.1